MVLFRAHAPVDRLILVMCILVLVFYDCATMKAVAIDELTQLTSS